MLGLFSDPPPEDRLFVSFNVVGETRPVADFASSLIKKSQLFRDADVWAQADAGCLPLLL